MNGDSDALSTPSDAVADKMQTVPEDVLFESRLVLLTFDSIVAGIVASVIGWTSLYYLFCTYFPHYTREWHCRWVTVLHASIVVALSAWSAFVQGPWPFTDPGSVSLFSCYSYMYVLCVNCKHQIQSHIFISLSLIFTANV